MITYLVTFSLLMTQVGVQVSYASDPDPADDYVDQICADADDWMCEDGTFHSIDYENEREFTDRAFGSGVRHLQAVLEMIGMFIGGVALVACPNQPSAIAFGLGSVAWLTGTLLTLDAYTKISDEQMRYFVNRSRQEETMEQVTALRAAAEMNREAAETIKKMRNWAITASVAYSAALVLGFVEIWVAKMTLGGTSECAIPEAARPPASVQNQMPTPSLEGLSFFSFRSLFLHTLFSISPLKASDANGDEDEDEDEDTSGASSTREYREWHDTGWFAGFGLILGASTGAVLAAITPLRESFQSAIGRPATRVIAYSVILTNTIASIVRMNKDWRALEADAKTYETIIERLERRAGSDGGFDRPGGGGGSIDPGSIGGGDFVDYTTPKSGGTCVQVTPTQGPRQSASCCGTNTCWQMPDSVGGFEGITLPNSLTEAIGGINNAGELAANGDLEAGSMAAGQAALHQSAINRARRDIMGRLKDVDNDLDNFKNDVSSARSQMRDDLITGYNRLSPREREQFNSALDSMFGLGSPSPLVENEEEKEEVIGSSDHAETAIGSDDSRSNRGMSFSFSDDRRSAQTPEQIARSMAAVELEHGGQEISSDSGRNIFQMITGRYFRTAYPIIFEQISPESKESSAD